MGIGFSGGQVGFDEGGVLNALSKPFFSRKTHHMKYNKKGEMIEEWWDEHNVSMATVIAALVLVAGPAILFKFNQEVISNPDVADVLKNAVFPSMTTDQQSVFKYIIDPFKLIWKR